MGFMVEAICTSKLELLDETVDMASNFLDGPYEVSGAQNVELLNDFNLAGEINLITSMGYHVIVRGNKTLDFANIAVIFSENSKDSNCYKVLTIKYLGGENIAKDGSKTAVTNNYTTDESPNFFGDGQEASTQELRELVNSGKISVFRHPQFVYYLDSQE